MPRAPRQQKPYVPTLSEAAYKALNSREFNPYVCFGKVTQEGLELLKATEWTEVVTSEDGFFETKRRISRKERVDLWLKRLNERR